MDDVDRRGGLGGVAGAAGVGGSGRVVGVVGARGGVGATTVAAALAGAAGRGRGRRRRSGAALPGDGGGAGGDVALVDLDGAGPGIDVHLGVESVPGLRWPDLRAAGGDVPGAELAALLPAWRGIPVLSVDRWRPGLPPPDVTADVVAALAACHRVVVVDVGRHGLLAGTPALRRCTTALVVGGRDVATVAGVVALRDRLWTTAQDVRLVLGGRAAGSRAWGGRGPGGLAALEVAHVVDLPVAATLPADRGLAAVLERGGGPVGGGPYMRTVGRLAEEVC